MARSLMSDADLTASLDEASPPEWVLLREGEWLELTEWCELLLADPASVLCSAMEGEECWRMCLEGIGDALGLPWGLWRGLARGLTRGLAFGLTLGLEVGVVLLPIACCCYRNMYVCDASIWAKQTQNIIH